jgi:hypothetical protein
LDPVKEGDALSDLWSRNHPSAFQPDGTARLIAATQAAFAGREDKRRVLFLKNSDFDGQGWRLGAAARFVEFLTAHTEDRVVAVLQDWSGVNSIPDTSVTVCSLWAVNHGSACSFGIPDLLRRLVAEFREVQIALQPDDFGDGGDVQSVDDLIGAVAGSQPRPGGGQ